LKEDNYNTVNDNHRVNNVGDADLRPLRKMHLFEEQQGRDGL
jgi:hypothetical protein